MRLSASSNGTGSPGIGLFGLGAVMPLSNPSLSTIRDLIHAAFQQQEFPERKNLPSAIAAAVGQLVARFSYIEHILASITHTLLGISTEHGRLSIQKFRAEQYMPLVETLLKLRGKKLSVNFKALGKRLDSDKKIRDMYAHGVWLKHPSKSIIWTYVLVTTGSWKVPGEREETRRAIKPEARIVTTLGLRGEIRQLDKTIAELESLRKQVGVS